MRRAAILLAAPVVLAACGSGSPSSSQVKLSPVAYVKQSALKTSQASSEHMTMSLTSSAQGQKVVMTGNGDFDNAKKQGDLQMHANVGGLDVPMEAVMDGTTMYLKSAVFQAALPSGKSWLKLDLQKAAAKSGIDFSSLLAQDPTQTFAQLQAAGDVTDVGAETIDGVAVEHYRVTIDLAKLPQGAAIEQLAHPKYSPENVWIGKDDGFVHRIDVAFTAAGIASSMLTNFSNFGQDVSIAVPPAAQTLDATNSSLKGLGG